jgi:NADPH-dependent 2,4-dienoyl-CoA reductase/sulfur reductase-like enzyme
VELVECLIHFGVPVDYLVRDPWYWPAALDGEEGAMVSDHLRHHKVNVVLQEEVGELFAEGGRLAAIRTKKGTHFPCDLLGVCIGVHPAIKWLNGITTPPETGRGIRVDRNFRTSLPDVFAAGDCAEIAAGEAQPFVEQIWYSAKRQGRLAGMAMLGDKIDYQPPLFFNSAKFFEIEYTTVGVVTRVPEGAASFYFRQPGREASIRLIEKDGRLIGVNMLGARWDHAVFERWIHERRSLDYAARNLRTAQFDVEFGRLDLGPFDAEYQARRAKEAA